MELWVDKYKPLTIDDYVFQDNDLRKLTKGFIKKGAIDNLLLYGPAGVGKSSLATLILKELQIDDADILTINGSKTGIDKIREEVQSFIMSGGWGSTFKIVRFEEADGITPAAQGALRADMEDYSNSVRWILTANYEHKIIKPIKDRCVPIHIKGSSEEAIIERLATILIAENIEITDENVEVIELLCKKHYPSIRGAIRALQRYCIDGTLSLPEDKSKNADLYEKVYKLFEKNDIRKARELLCGSLAKEDIEQVYVWLYQNLHLFKDKDQSILMISDGLRHHPMSSDPEINLSATLTQLVLING